MRVMTIFVFNHLILSFLVFRVLTSVDGMPQVICTLIETFQDSRQ